MLPVSATSEEKAAMTQGEALLIGTASGLAIFEGPAGSGQWRERARLLSGHAVRAVVATDATALLAAADGLAPQQSFDGGESWADAPGAAIEPVGLRVATLNGPVELLNPRLAGATAYARIGGRSPVLVGAGAGGIMLFRSIDDGIHWEPAAVAGGVAGRISALAPGGGSRLWAGTDAGQLLRSDDRGESWREAARLESPILCLAALRSSPAT
jgi:photosystem II stability/assembly factor-like uncharacterized protein